VTATKIVTKDGVQGGGPLGLAALKRLLSGGGDQRQVTDAVHALSDAELMQFGLRAFHMNLLSLFGQTRPPEEIARTARAAAISKILGGWEYHHHYLPRLSTTPDRPRISDLPIGEIKDILSRGRGLVVVSFHLGPMRYLPSDLAHAGVPTCIPLATDAFGDYASARAANPGAALWTGFRIVNVEEAGGAVTLAKVLAGGGCVVSAADGNTGLDGPRGDHRRLEVRIGEALARVKTGLFAMAARFGAPVLVAPTYTCAGERVCRVGPLIDPGSALKGRDNDDFAEAAARAAYAFFGAALEDHADEWCGGDLFHQWRVPSKPPRHDLAEVARGLSRSLAEGGRLAINRRRIVPLEGPCEIVWSDAPSGRCYRLPAEMADLAALLAEPGGVGLEWIDRHVGAERSQLWTLLCQLASHEAIHAVKRRHSGADAPRLSEIARPSMHGAGNISRRMHQTG
jgi:hypothetical protein